MTKKKKKNFLLSAIQLPAGSDPWITIFVFVLALFGTLMIVSTNVGQTISSPGIVLSTSLKQIITLLIGYICMLAASKFFNFRIFSRMQVVVFIVMFVMMILPFGFAESGGSHAWIRLPGGFTIQPAEFVKPLMILLVATAVYISKKKKHMADSPKSLFSFPFRAMLLFTVELLAQRDLGTLTIVFVVFFICLLIPDYPTLVRFQRRLKLLAFAGVAAAVVLFGATDIGTDILAKTPFSHVAVRIENMKNPYEADKIYGESYQPANSLYGIGSSNFFGKGIGESARKYGYLTQADNDYILAVIIEETGIFGFGLIVLLYFLLIGRLFYFAFKTNEVVHKIVLGGTATYLFMHFFLNVGGVVCLIPFTGVPLLFISSGGSSLFAINMAIGVCQYSISRIRMKETI